MSADADIRSIRWNFDHHYCLACKDAKRPHKVGHVLVDTNDLRGDFMLRCTCCGAEAGPYAGPRMRDDRGEWIQRY